MVDEMRASINYLSQKLEQLPLANYLFLGKPQASNTKRELNSKGLFFPNSTQEHNRSNQEAFMECLEDKIANTKKSQFEDEGKNKNNYEDKTCTTLNNKQRPICTPTFSDSLPVTHIKKSSPNKRKRSSNENLYNDDECLSFTRSCDFEVSNICSRDFRSIQRTLSFDDDLLRYENEATRTTSPIQWNSPKSRPSGRSTCKSQPSFAFERYAAVGDVKSRKVKIVQLSRNDVNMNERQNCNVGKTLPLSLSNTNSASEHTFKSINSQIDSEHT